MPGIVVSRDENVYSQKSNYTLEKTKAVGLPFKLGRIGRNIRASIEMPLLGISDKDEGSIERLRKGGINEVHSGGEFPT